MFFFKSKHLFLAIMLAIAIAKSSARPGQFEEFGYHFENKCKQGDVQFLLVCQRCAKQTKSPIVYPMCCINEDDVFDWCLRYINYGKTSS